MKINLLVRVIQSRFLQSTVESRRGCGLSIKENILVSSAGTLVQATARALLNRRC